MKDNETIVEMITRFTDIINGLKALGKTYKELEKVIVGKSEGWPRPSTPLVFVVGAWVNAL